MNIVISATGLYTPPETVTNEELVVAFNQYVDNYNAEHATAIDAGEVEALKHSSPEFIYKASGIKSRHVVDKAGILDPDVMHPRIRTRGNDEPSIQCEMALDAAQQCLAEAGREAGEIDAILVACSNLPRAYPALAVEVQQFVAQPAHCRLALHRGAWRVARMGQSCSRAGVAATAAVSGAA